MGFWKSLAKGLNIVNPVGGNFMGTGLGLDIANVPGSENGHKSSDAAPAAAAPSGSLSEAEAQAAEASRYARLSRYFTTAMGLLGNAKTGSAKVFS
ncbi:MAG: hypothetical protein WC551_10445 [Patescibacteria group bacterium]